jgi:hypothetical protein
MERFQLVSFLPKVHMGVNHTVSVSDCRVTVNPHTPLRRWHSYTNTVAVTPGEGSRVG